MHKRLLPTSALGMMLLAAGCGGSSSTASDGPCPAAPFSGTITRIEDGAGQLAGNYSDETFADGDTRFTLFDDHYSTYIADQKLSASTSPNAEEGGVVVYVYLDGAGPFVEGETVSLSSRGPRVDNAGTSSYKMGTIDPSSQATIIAHTETELCFDVSYADDYQTIDGTFSTRVGE